jgi:hypothetical protein
MLRTFVLREETHAQALWTFLKKNWNAMAREGKPLAVTVNEHKAKRSAEQNKLYWDRLRAISEQAWIDGKRFSAEAWHEHYKRKLIGYEELPGGGSVGISTTTLSVAEFSDHIERVTEHAVTHLGIILE